MLAVLVVLAELPPQRDVPYVVFPALLWAALRFGPRGAATAILIVCSITVWNTAQNDGPFVRDSLTDSLLATQLFIATAAVTSLLLAAVTAERTRDARALAATEAAQRALADEQAALRRVATLVAGDAPPSRVFEQVTEEVGRLLGMPGANVMQYDGVRTATVVGAWSETDRRASRSARRSTSTATRSSRGCVRSGSAARVDRYERHAAGRSEAAGWATGPPSRRRSTSAARLWGVLAAASTSDDAAPGGHRAAAVRLRRPRRAGAGQRRRVREARRVARAARRGRRRRAAAARAQPPRRRAAAPRLGRPRAEHGHGRLESDPAAARELLETAQAISPGPRRAARAGARHPPGRPDRARARRPALDALRGARAAAGRGHDAARRAARRAGRGGGVLRRRRGDHERRQVRARVERDRRRPPLERHRHGDGLRRRRRRRRSGGRLRAARAHRAGRGAERPAEGRQPTRGGTRITRPRSRSGEAPSPRSTASAPRRERAGTCSRRSSGRRSATAVHRRARDQAQWLCLVPGSLRVLREIHLEQQLAIRWRGERQRDPRRAPHRPARALRLEPRRCRPRPARRRLARRPRPRARTVELRSCAAEVPITDGHGGRALGHLSNVETGESGDVHIVADLFGSLPAGDHAGPLFLSAEGAVQGGMLDLRAIPLNEQPGDDAASHPVISGTRAELADAKVLHAAQPRPAHRGAGDARARAASHDRRIGAAVQPLNLRTRTGVDEPRFALGSSGPDRRPPGPLRYGPSSPVLAVRQHQHPSNSTRSDHLLPTTEDPPGAAY